MHRILASLLALLALPGSAAESAVAANLERAWDITWRRFYLPQVQTFGDYLSSYEPGREQAHLPTPEEVRRQFPNPCGYSTGMAQRVKLAQALVHDPRVLILDEPTNGLDPEGREEMLSLVSRTGREFGISVLVSSHLLGELERICERIVLIEQGRLLRAERVGSLTSETATLVVELDGDDAAVAAFVAHVAAAGLLVQPERQRVLMQLPDTSEAAQLDAAYDVVRDAAAVADVGLLRLERRRGHLADLFAGAAS